MVTVVVDPSDDRSAADLGAVLTARSAARSRPAIRDGYEASDASARRAPRGRSADQRRPAVSCHHGPIHGRHLAGQPRPRLRRLGVPSRGVARQMAAAAGEGRAQRRFVWRPMRRRPAATPTVRAVSSRCRKITASGRRVAALAVQFDLPGISAEPTMVAQRDDRHRRCVGPPRASRLLRHETAARRRLTGQFHRDKSRSSRDDDPRRRAEPRPRRHESLRGLGAHDGRQTAAWSRGVPAGPGPLPSQRVRWSTAIG